MGVPRYTSFKPIYKDSTINVELKRKSLNIINSKQSIKRTQIAITKTNRFKSVNGVYSNVIQYWFKWFKTLAIVTHKSLEQYYYLNGIAERTFSYYLGGVYLKIDIVRLFNLFAYFRYNGYMVERLKAIGCDIESLTFERFIALDSLPLPNGESYSVAIDYLALLPESFPNPDEVQTPKRKNYSKKVK